MTIVLHNVLSGSYHPPSVAQEMLGVGGMGLVLLLWCRRRCAMYGPLWVPEEWEVAQKWHEHMNEMQQLCRYTTPNAPLPPETFTINLACKLSSLNPNYIHQITISWNIPFVCPFDFWKSFPVLGGSNVRLPRSALNVLRVEKILKPGPGSSV